jgi:HAD superfamily phosphoserine phosphatase-like hydrolase
MSNKQKYLAVFDFDGVIYKGHLIFDFIKYQEQENLIPGGTWDNILHLRKSYKEGNLNYKDAANDMLIRIAKSLRGISYKSVKSDVIAYLEDNRDNFYNYFSNLIKKLKKTHNIYIISTNFQFIIEPVCELFDLSGYISSLAEVKSGIFTGKVKQSLAGNKDLINNLFIKHTKTGSIAVGDSENDIKMLERVEFPICFEPNQKLKVFAQKMGWVVANSKDIQSKILHLLKL